MADSRTVFIDARPEDEYTVSHIPRAVRVDPKLDGDALAETLRSALSGRDGEVSDVIVYCSVGERSSALIERACKFLTVDEQKRFKNLEGGIFAWASAKLPLDGERGRQGKVHGFDPIWKHLLPEHQRFLPEDQRAPRRSQTTV
ncbi:MAG: rhodanese-like domain-containing protein [Maricaulaceae bacterium]